MEEEKKFTIYLHRCPNGKCYVGMTSTTLKSRWQNGRGYKKNKDFYPDIQKYGWDNIEHIILEEGLNREDACESEKYNIKKYNCIFPNGYNTAIGGEAPWNIGIKMLEYNSNYINPRSGKNLTKNQRIYVDNKKEKINQYNIYGEYIKTYNSLTDVSNYHNMEVGGIINSIKRCGLVEEKYMYDYFKHNNKLNNIEPYFIKNNRERAVVIDGYVFRSTKECDKYLGISLTLKYLNGIRKLPNKYAKRGLRYYEYPKDKNIRLFTDNNTIVEKNKSFNNSKVVVDNMIFNSKTDCSKYLYKANSTIGQFLNNSKPMPQKYIDRGLRYYNPETDKDLPIYENKD